MKKFIDRLKEPTPRFFRKVRNYGLLLTTISAVLTTAVIPLPPVIIVIAGYAALAGGIASAISQTAIEQDPP